MAWLLDTNILSELRRPKPEPRVVAFIAGQPLDDLYISVVTVAEIRFGIELVGEPNRRASLAWVTAASSPASVLAASTICINLAPAGALYKKLVESSEGYAGGVPIIHQAVAAKAAIDALDGAFEEDSDPN
jgi:predicted nucleic acid-binding protein